MEIAGEVIFQDHHLYTAKDLTFIRKKVNEVDWVVTTEKDMVKLKKLDIDDLPMRALRIKVRIREEEEFYKKVLEIF